MLWEIPKAQLNQELHVHYVRNGLQCRRAGAKRAQFALLQNIRRLYALTKPH